jgi:hypothetical protein
LEKKKKKKNVFKTQTIVQADTTVRIPELQGDGLTIELDKYDGLEYWACFKLGGAAPAAAGRNHWSTAGYCELFHFTNTTATTEQGASSSVKRAVLRVPDNLRGVGSHAGDMAAESVLVDSLHSNVHARRSVAAAAARGVAVQNVRAGTYYITISAATGVAANTTLSLKLSGLACPAAGQYGPTCAALSPVAEGVSFPFNNIAANGSAAARFGDSKLINDTTAALTIAAQVDTTDGSVSVLARWGGVPTADVFDAKVVVADKGVQTAQVIAPRAANWYFAVLNNNNKTAVNANITVTLTQCGAGLFGAQCNTTVADLDKPGQVADHDQVAAGDSFYYKFNANATTAAQFRALLAGVNADALAVAAALTVDPDANVNVTAPSIYARRGALPTANDFDYVDCTVASCADDQNTLIVSSADVANPETNQLWYVLVVANTAGSLHVWNAAGGACAGNCNEHGKCNTELAACTCDEDYASFDCLEPKSALERWEWALIIGGAVLVAIGLIGCIVYFIQRQSRRAGFERV